MMYVKMIIAALIIMCGSAVSNAAEWVLIDPPTYMSRNDYNCTVTFTKGGYSITTIDGLCVLRKGTYGIINGGGALLHNIVPPFCHCGCNHYSHQHSYLLQRPRWSHYSIFHYRRYRRCVR
jgi:hypothetical protein